MVGVVVGGRVLCLFFSFYRWVISKDEVVVGARGGVVIRWYG